MSNTEFGATRADSPLPTTAHSSTAPSSTARPSAGLPDDGRVPQRVSTETKSSFKATELFVYLGSVAAVILTCLYITSGKDARNVDYFRADKAILYIVFLTIGYLLSRGLAKSGAREPYDR